MTKPGSSIKFVELLTEQRVSFCMWTLDCPDIRWPPACINYVEQATSDASTERSMLNKAIRHSEVEGVARMEDDGVMMQFEQRQRISVQHGLGKRIVEYGNVICKYGN